MARYRSMIWTWLQQRSNNVDANKRCMVTLFFHTYEYIRCNCQAADRGLWALLGADNDENSGETGHNGEGNDDALQKSRWDEKN